MFSDVRSWISSGKLESTFDKWKIDVFSQFIKIKNWSMSALELAQDFKTLGFSYYELLLAKGEDLDHLKEDTRLMKDKDGWLDLNEVDESTKMGWYAQ
jgi:hypothetical protein